MIAKRKIATCTPCQWYAIRRANASSRSRFIPSHFRSNIRFSSSEQGSTSTVRNDTWHGCERTEPVAALSFVLHEFNGKFCSSFSTTCKTCHLWIAMLPGAYPLGSFESQSSLPRSLAGVAPTAPNSTPVSGPKRRNVFSANIEDDDVRCYPYKSIHLLILAPGIRIRNCSRTW